jgi:putative ABC transport system permease protein
VTGWLFNRLFLRRILRTPLRVSLLLCALALSTSLWLAVSYVGASGVRSFEESLGLSASEYPLIVTPQSGRISQPFMQHCVVPLADRFGILALRRERAAVAIGGSLEPVQIIGVSGAGSGPANTFTEFSNDDVVVDSRTQALLKLRTGAPIEYTIGSTVLRGTVREESGSTSALPGQIFRVPLNVISSIEPAGVVDTLLLKPPVTTDLEGTRSSLARWFASCGSGVFTFGQPTNTMRIETPQSTFERGEALLQAYRMNVTVLAVVTLLVCGILISHAAQLSLLTVSRELSIARTIGVSRSWCSAAVMSEAFVVGVLGALLGVTLGYPVTVFLTQLLLNTAHEVYRVDLGAGYSTAGTITLYLGVIFLVVVTALAGSLISAYRARSVPLGVSTRREGIPVAIVSRSFALAAAIIVTLILGGSWWIAQNEVRSEVPRVLIAYLFVSSGVVWSVGCVPIALLYIPRFLKRLICGLLPVSGRLAISSIHSFGGGHMLGVMALTTAVSLLVALSLMVDSFRETLGVWTTQRLQGDLFLSIDLTIGKGPETKISSEALSRMSALLGVREVRYYKEARETVGGREVVVGGSQVVPYLRDAAYRFTDGDLQTTEFDPVNSIFVSEGAASRLKLKAGDSVNLNRRLVRIARILREFSTDRPFFLMDISLFDQVYPGQGADSVTLFADPGVDREELRASVQELGGIGAHVRNQEELRSFVMEMFDRTFRITSSVRWIVLAIAGIGMLVSFLQQVWERRRELKSMRVLGVSRMQMTGSLGLEIALVALVAGPVGLIGGSVIGWGLVTYVNPFSFGWSLDFHLTTGPFMVTALFLVGISLLITTACRLALVRLIDTAKLADE